MSAYQKIQYRQTHRGSSDTAFHSIQVAGKSLPAINFRDTGKAPIQLYKDKKNGFKISDNKQFAVFDEGKPDSKMYATEKAKPVKLNEEVVTFTMKDTSDEYPRKYGMKEVVPDKKMNADLIKEIHCGPFSKLATGKQEKVENENAPPGRSLFVDDFKWSDPPDLKPEKKSRGSWENHFAPVIVQDGDDRGTFETAVHIDHTYFGIYGSKKGQTFRLKTVMADIELSVTRGLLSRGLADKLKEAINDYVEDNPSGTEDEYIKKEIEKIDSISKSHPDIDQPFREKEASAKSVQVKENAFWQLVKTSEVEEIWSYIQGQGNLMSALISFQDCSKKAKLEGNSTVEEKIKICVKRINAELSKKSGLKSSSGIGTGTVVAGAVIASGIALGIIAALLKKMGYFK